MTRNSSFSHVLDIFMSYSPQFWGSRTIYKDLKTRYMFESYEQNLVVFVFSDYFHELLPTVFGFQMDLHGSYDSLHVLKIWPETCRFRVFWPFSWVITHNIWDLGGFAWLVFLHTCLRDMAKNMSFSCFIAHSFGFPGWLTAILRPQTCLRVTTKNS